MKQRVSLILTLILILLLCVSCKVGGAKIDTSDWEVEIMALEQIWEIEEPYNLVSELDMYVSDKCQYGDNISVLTEPERILFVVCGVEMEVNNGGFAQYFFNSSGNFANETVAAFQMIGASKTAEICRRANSVFGEEVPVDWNEREEALNQLPDEVDEILENCDNDFFEYEEDIRALLYEYVLKHKSEFS